MLVPDCWDHTVAVAKMEEVERLTEDLQCVESDGFYFHPAHFPLGILGTEPLCSENTISFINGCQYVT